MDGLVHASWHESSFLMHLVLGSEGLRLTRAHHISSIFGIPLKLNQDLRSHIPAVEACARQVADITTEVASVHLDAYLSNVPGDMPAQSDP